MLCFSFLLPAIIAQGDLVRALSEQSKYCSTHAEGVSLYADPPVIKQAAAGKSANHHVLQHQVLSGQAAQQAEVCRCVCAHACMHTLLCLLTITLQAAVQKILHIPEKYSPFPNTHQGIKIKMTPALTCLPNQRKIVLNWTQSSGGLKCHLSLGCCAELGNYLGVSIQLLMLYLYQSSVFLNKLSLKAKVAKNIHRAEQTTIEESSHWRAGARWRWSALTLASKFSQNFHSCSFALSTKLGV